MSESSRISIFGNGGDLGTFPSPKHNIFGNLGFKTGPWPNFLGKSRISNGFSPSLALSMLSQALIPVWGGVSVLSPFPGNSIEAVGRSQPFPSRIIPSSPLQPWKNPNPSRNFHPLGWRIPNPSSLHVSALQTRIYPSGSPGLSSVLTFPKKFQVFTGMILIFFGALRSS